MSKKVKDEDTASSSPEQKTKKASFTGLDTLSVLLWKNFTIKRKRKLTSCCEAGVPIFFICMVLLLKGLTTIQDVPEGWTFEGIAFCPYTGKEADSTLSQAPCNVPYEYFYQEVDSADTLLSFINGQQSDHPFGKLFLVHSGEEAEINAANDFVTFMETTGLADFGPLNNFSNGTFIFGDGTVSELEDYITAVGYGDPFTAENPEVIAAIFFEEMNFDTAQFQYRIRLNLTSDDFTTTITGGDGSDPVDELQREIDISDFSEYLQLGFLRLQIMMDTFLINAAFDGYEQFPLIEVPVVNITEFETERSIFEPGNVRAVAYPVSEYTVDAFFEVIETVLPLLFIMVYIMPVSQIISVIVIEKEVRAREMMKLMGVSNLEIIASWYITYIVYFALISFFFTVVGIGIFPSSAEAAGGFSFLLFFIYFFFGLALLAFCFVMSTLFQKSFNGVVAGLTVFIAFFFVYFSFSSESEIPGIVLLLPQVTFSLTTRTLTLLEAQGVGVNSESLDLEVLGFSVGKGLGWLFFDFFYLTLLGLYLDAVVPSEFGQTLPFYFPLQPSFWKKKIKQIKIMFGIETIDYESHNMETPMEKDKHFEEVNENLKSQLDKNVGLKIRNLTKTFSTPDGPKTAVDDLSFDVYEGQILVLLGHNGAGKTTTLQMLSGMLTPTSGDSLLYGDKLSTDLASIRQNLGFCPQHDVLYKELTVYDHLKFYAQLKGLRGRKLENAINETITHLGLTEKRKIASSNLSGGMKRKLSLGISLIGGSQIIFVDEPTSGVDTYSRRAMWEVLQDSREGRVIILTTHFMDEADLLGDRIAIMAEGKLKCIGSSLFLKNLYGAGYKLTFVKEKNCNSEAVFDLIKQHVEDAKITSDIGTELTFHLPLKDSKKFADLFTALDEKVEDKELMVSGYGVSVTTMEEVFLKSGQSADLLEGMELEEKHEEEELKGNPKEPTMYTKLPESYDSAFTLFCLPFLRQYVALVTKRYRYAKRDFYSFICNTFVPGVILAVGLAAITTAGSQNVAPPLELSVDQWNTGFSTRGFFPIVELSLNEEIEFGQNRIGQQQNFDQVVLEEPFEDRTDPDTVDRTVFTQGYESGHSNNCSLFIFESTCDLTGPAETGNAILDLGSALLNPDELFVEQINERNGASNFMSAIVQPETTSQNTLNYALTMLLNTTAVHGAPITFNTLTNALLRRSLVEYFDFEDNTFDDLDVGSTDSAASFTAVEGGEFGTIDVVFTFPEDVAAPKITAFNHPLPFTAQFEELLEAILGLVSSTSVVIAFAFVPGPMISYVVMEKEEAVQIKHLQFVSGVGIVAYWLANFSFDIINYILPFAVGLLLIQAFEIDAFIDDGAFGVIANVFFGYGMAIIPFSYLVGHLFSKHTSALIWIIIINCMTGFTLMIITFVVELVLPDSSINKWKYVFRLFPGFCLGDSLLQISTSSLIDGESSFYDADVAGANVVYLYLESIAFLFLTMLVEYLQTLPGVVDFYSKMVMNTKAIEAENQKEVQDEDVAAEAKRVLEDDARISEGGVKDEETATKEDVIRMVNLRKQYFNGKVAVKNITLGIPEGECFGYLGINGAGKTTTMKCLTGDVFPTSGTGYIRGYNIVSDQTNVRQHVGYCSQFSSYLGLLTVKEHLELFCNVKQIEDVELTVNTLLRRLSLVPFKNKLAKSLSGGNKRKLNVAIAMIGSPAVMLLDEPSTGMDVASRRFMWKVVENMSTGRYDGRKTSVVLTTHSMEECEALCSRVGIMVGGRMKCLGSVQHLKSRFGTGFTIEAKLEYITADEIETQSTALESGKTYVTQEDIEDILEKIEPGRYKKYFADPHGQSMVLKKKLEVTNQVSLAFLIEWALEQTRVDKLKEFLGIHFTGLEVVEAHDYRLTFRVEKDEKTRLANIFKALEDNKEDLKIAEYAVSQTTLEQIFNGFAATQEEEKGIPRGMVQNNAETPETGVSI